MREALSIYLFYGACLILGLSILAVDLEIRPLVTQSFVLLEYLPLAFLAGYVVPGAPGGLGVRESLLVVLLGNEMGDSQALALALQFRLATVAADLLLFGIACAMKWQGESATPEPPRQTES
ncbi:MAG: hypothetical protein DWQ36_18240 [Acidobacteria bacterium]|nr:MAG: hypothetical protein DWQ30_15310 [Acidobacteriota bacterium]REK04371.1 MAG: hypothetical protein DWQ36_18240 [Acidobacteriota bacterium]